MSSPKSKDVVAPEFDVAHLERSIVRGLIYLLGKDPVDTNTRDWFQATAYVVRDALIGQWMESMRSYYLNDAKRVYYLSMEFLMGRTLGNAISNLRGTERFKEALQNVGLRLEDIEEFEAEAGLGNGGLGRLAACFLDSLASLNMPGFGYGIRYEYGLFAQDIDHGWQIEHPDNWLRWVNPWEFPRTDVQYRVQFGGYVEAITDETGKISYRWNDTDDVMAMAYDTPIPGYGGHTVNNLRLWSARATSDFNLRYFNEGNYIRAVDQKNRSENLSKVLYPDDSTLVGRELRLKQEYFFVSASLQDILKSFQQDERAIDQLSDEVAIQLNDTHPAIAIPELMRLLLDSLGLEWNRAWSITTRIFSYTNHTLMPEALETWPVSLMGRLLPRHLDIIYEINRRFLETVQADYSADDALLRRLSLIDEENGKRVRMSHLAIVGSHKVNGVAALHSQLMQTTIFRDFARLYPDRFMNITNGVTPRRWLHQANPGLSALITKAIGPDWIRDLSEIRKLEPFADDPGFRAKFRESRRQNKLRWMATAPKGMPEGLDPDSLFDVQVKRIHEYKRQLLNVLHVVARYRQLLSGDNALPKRTVIIGGKAAPAYLRAKLIIKLINDVAFVINNDPRIQGRLKLYFLPDYCVSRAMKLIPAIDLSEQISTAGTEASGTGNMKMSINGALTIGTYDGANIEILEAVGKENFFLFGNTEEELQEYHRNGYRALDFFERCEPLRGALEMIASGQFSPDEPYRFQPIIDSLLHEGDQFMLMADFESYLEGQDAVDRLWMDPDEWSRKAILNIARTGRFSSDRAIETYAREIWKIAPRTSQAGRASKKN
jgi:glycogen phosphorylase